MKVCVVQAALDARGVVGPDGDVPISVTSVRQVASLRAIGVQVDVVALRSRTSPTLLRADIGAARERLSKDPPDLVHGHYGAVVGASAWGISRGIAPLALSLCGGDLVGTGTNEGPIWNVRTRIGIELSLFAARKSSLLIVKSDVLRRALPDALAERASILPNGVDTDLFSPDPDPSERGEGRGGGPRTIVFNASSGHNRTVKNRPLAEAAVRALRERGVDVELHVFAGGTAGDAVRDAMRRADCLLVTSFHEGSPNIVKEAMSCGLPVVSVDCGDVAERLSGVNVGGIAAATPDALADALEATLRSSASFNGRVCLLEQGLDERATAARLLSLYARTVEAGAGRAPGARERQSQ